jgi:hypothetical protein
MWPFQHQCRALAVSDEFIALVEGAVREHDDAIVRARLADPCLEYLRLDPERVAQEHGQRKTHLVPPEVGHRRAMRRVVDRNADHEAERQATVDEDPAELGVLHRFRVEMQCGRIVRQGGNEDIVRLGDGAPDRVLEHLSHHEFFEIQARHLRSTRRSQGIADLV